MEKTDVILVLGHRLLPGDLPSEDLKRRIDRAVALWKETGAPMIMPCGGLTEQRHRTEAEVMKEMLIERGVPESIIRLEDRSRITLENMLNAYELVGPDVRVAVVSSDYHMDMALNDCRAVGLNAYGVGAETPDAAYRDEMRRRLNGFEERINALRAQGVTNRQIIDMFMERKKDGLTHLGSKVTKYPSDYAPDMLESFTNRHPERDYFVKFNCPEFTSLCPITGQPDFGNIVISYVPDMQLVESKSLKLYLFSFRNHGDFHEDVVNVIMNDLIRKIEPKYIEVWGRFLPRGGLSIDPYCNWGKPGTAWEQTARDRLKWHDLLPEDVRNR